MLKSGNLKTQNYFPLPVLHVLRGKFSIQNRVSIIACPPKADAFDVLTPLVIPNLIGNPFSRRRPWVPALSRYPGIKELDLVIPALSRYPGIKELEAKPQTNHFLKIYSR
jgi:hypothetical protein